MSVRFALLGHGLWGAHHARAIARTPGAELVAIAARSDSAADARASHPAAVVVADWRACLARADVDVVDVVLPDDMHEEVAVAALEAGKHVLLEKPMATTLAGCDRILRAARAAGRVLCVGHELRLSSQWGAIRGLLDAGRLGRPLHVFISLWRRPYRGGSEGWRYDRARVGSWLLEETIHYLDLALWYLESLGPPVAVVAAGNSKGREPGLYDNFSTLIRWPDGAHATINQTLAGFGHHQAVHVVGTAGSVRATWSASMDRTRQATALVEVLEGLTGHERFDIGEPAVLPLGAPSGELYELEAEIAAMVDAVRTGRPFMPPEAARRAVAVCLAAEESARTGREIVLGV